MFSTIMVPVDLAHADTLDKSIKIAADLGKQYNARIYVVGVTASAPGAVAHDPAEYAQKLDEFTAAHSQAQGIDMIAKPVHCNDPAVELDDALQQAGHEIGVDLVVMASHIPGFMDHLFHSKAGHLATHTDISVFIVR